MLQSMKRRKGDVKEESYCFYFLQPFYSLLAQDGGISLRKRCREGAEFLSLTRDCSICQGGGDACFRHSKCSLYRLQRTQKQDCTVHVDSFYVLQVDADRSYRPLSQCQWRMDQEYSRLLIPTLRWWRDEFSLPKYTGGGPVLANLVFREARSYHPRSRQHP